MSDTFNKTVLISPLIKMAASIIVLAGIMSASSIILPLLLAVFISIICAQPILWLVKKKVPSWLAILLVLGGVGFLFFVLGSVIGKSLSQFSANLPQYEARLNEFVLSIGHKFEFAKFGLSVDEIIGKIDTAKVLGFTSSLLSQLGGIMSNSFLILLVTIFILAEMGAVTMKVKVLQRDYNKQLNYLNELSASIRYYLSLKTVISLATGVFITVWLSIMGVDYPILWGVIAFLLNYIPNIGSIIAAVPTMLLALVQLGVGGFIWTGVAYLVVNIIMGSVVEPKIMGKGLGLSTLVVFLSLIVWGYIFGAVGMFLSVPITLSIKIILDKNESTRWVALLLGSEKDAEKAFNEKAALNE